MILILVPWEHLEFFISNFPALECNIAITVVIWFSAWGAYLLLVLYTTWNDPQPQMIPKIDLNMTWNDPRPQMIPQFCRMQPEMIPEELSEWNGMMFNSQGC